MKALFFVKGWIKGADFLRVTDDAAACPPFLRELPSPAPPPKPLVVAASPTTAHRSRIGFEGGKKLASFFPKDSVDTADLFWFVTDGDDNDGRCLSFNWSL